MPTVFYDSTVFVDANALYREFLPLFTKTAHILDAGCGSGRDALAFLKRGYQVTAFDGSERLSRYAVQLTGLQVKTALFDTFQSEVEFDGIWACASLLHVPEKKLPHTLNHLAGFLTDSGYFYCSFKYGQGESKREGRHFTNLDENGLEQLLESTVLKPFKVWVTTDLRPGRENERWLNAILIKG